MTTAVERQTAHVETLRATLTDTLTRERDALQAYQRARRNTLDAELALHLAYTELVAAHQHQARL